MATVPIDESTRLVTIRFRFSNPSAIPEALRQRMIAPKTGPVARSRGSSIVIEATENVSLDEFFRELEAAGYVLVDGFYVVQPNSENAAKTQHLVRFTFCRLEHAVSSDHFKRVQPHIQAGLQYICNAAFWRTTAYSNPFTKNDEEVAGVRVLSFSFDARNPRLLQDGSPALQRRRDPVTKKPIGDPVPLVPTYRLSIVDGTAMLVD